MRQILLKLLLVLVQSSTLTVLLGYLIFRSQLVVIPAFLSIVVLMNLRCSVCGTSFQDEKIYKRLKLIKFYDTKIIDSCPVCNNPMYKK